MQSRTLQKNTLGRYTGNNRKRTKARKKAGSLIRRGCWYVERAQAAKSNAPANSAPITRRRKKAVDPMLQPWYVIFWQLITGIFKPTPQPTHA